MSTSTNTAPSDFTDITTLENLVVQQIAATLWNQDLWTPPLDRRNYPQLPASEYVKTLKKAKSLELPQTIKKLLYQRIISMGHQISKWMNHVYLELGVSSWENSDIYWTCWNLIDVERTIKEWLEKNTDDWTNLKWACQHSLHDTIPALYHRLPPDLQTSWSTQIWEDEFNETSLEFWTQFLNDREKTMDDNTQGMLLEALKSGNLAAVKHLWSLESAQTHMFLLTTSYFFGWDDPSALFFPTVFSFFEQILTHQQKILAVMSCRLENYPAIQYAKGCPREEFLLKFLATFGTEMIDWFDMMDFLLTTVKLESRIMEEFDEKVPFTWRNTFKVLWPRRPFQKPLDKLLINFVVCLLMMEDVECIKCIIKDVKDIGALRTELEPKLSDKPLKYKNLLDSVFEEILQNKQV